MAGYDFDWNEFFSKPGNLDSSLVDPAATTNAPVDPILANQEFQRLDFGGDSMINPHLLTHGQTYNSFSPSVDFGLATNSGSPNARPDSYGAGIVPSLYATTAPSAHSLTTTAKAAPVARFPSLSGPAQAPYQQLHAYSEPMVPSMSGYAPVPWQNYQPPQNQSHLHPGFDLGSNMFAPMPNQNAELQHVAGFHSTVLPPPMLKAEADVRISSKPPSTSPHNLVRSRQTSTPSPPWQLPCLRELDRPKVQPVPGAPEDTHKRRHSSSSLEDIQIERVRPAKDKGAETGDESDEDEQYKDKDAVFSVSSYSQALKVYGKPRRPPPPPWGPLCVTPGKRRAKPIFEYESTGELKYDRYFTRKEMRSYLYASDEGFTENFKELPLRPGEKRVPGKRRSGLTLWISMPPPQLQKRYPSSSSHKCRFRDCPIDMNTIQAGHPQVIFDEWMNTDGRSVDPFVNAGYVHLFCLERHFDLVQLWKELDVRRDERSFLREKINHGSIERPKGKLSVVVEAWMEDQWPRFVESFVQDPETKRFKKTKRQRDFYVGGTADEKTSETSQDQRRGSDPWVCEEWQLDDKLWKPASSDYLTCRLIRAIVTNENKAHVQQRIRRAQENKNACSRAASLGNLYWHNEKRERRREKRRRLKRQRREEDEDEDSDYKDDEAEEQEKEAKQTKPRRKRARKNADSKTVDSKKVDPETEEASTGADGAAPEISTDANPALESIPASEQVLTSVPAPTTPLAPAVDSDSADPSELTGLERDAAISVATPIPTSEPVPTTASAPAARSALELDPLNPLGIPGFGAQADFPGTDEDFFWTGEFNSLEFSQIDVPPFDPEQAAADLAADFLGPAAQSAGLVDPVVQAPSEPQAQPISSPASRKRAREDEDEDAGEQQRPQKRLSTGTETEERLPIAAALSGSPAAPPFTPQGDNDVGLGASPGDDLKSLFGDSDAEVDFDRLLDEIDRVEGTVTKDCTDTAKDDDNDDGGTGG